MPYAFEMMPNLTEIQAYDGDEIVLFPHNETNNYSEKIYNYTKVGRRRRVPTLAF